MTTNTEDVYNQWLEDERLLFNLGEEMETKDMTLQIQEGKYYRTRDGRKVGPAEWLGDFDICWDIPLDMGDGTKGFYGYYPNGTLCVEFPERNIVAEWKDTGEDMELKKWKDMTDEEKGALLLAYHEGKTIEWSYGLPWQTAYDSTECKPIWNDPVAYRVKPAPKEPKRETVTVGWDGNTPCRDLYKSVDTHKITFDLIDGVPDCDSIKMEEI